MAFFGVAIIAVDINIKVHIPTAIELPIVFITLLYRKIRYGYPFRRIPLTQGLYAIVDPQDYVRLSKYKWHVRVDCNTCYAGRSETRQKGGKRKVILMHREIVKVPKWLFVDHINHNGLDNRRANLRPASIKENSYNRRKIRGKTDSRYKGVCLTYDKKRWRAHIWVEGKVKHLGKFENEVEAAQAYDHAAKKLHGEFAALNFPPPHSPNTDN